MNQDDEVVAKNLAQNFVPHGGFRLATAQRVGKFSLYGAEGRFDIGALVVAVLIFLRVVLGILETLFPVFVAFTPRHIALECNVWRCASATDYLENGV